MTINLVCERCGRDSSDHITSYGRCADGGWPPGFSLEDSHAHDNIPPAVRRFERLLQSTYPTAEAKR